MSDLLGCSTCYPVRLPNCFTNLVATLDANTAYQAVFTNQFGKKKIIDVTSEADGSITIEATEFPAGYFLNPVTLEFFEVASGGYGGYDSDNNEGCEAVQVCETYRCFALEFYEADPVENAVIRCCEEQPACEGSVTTQLVDEDGNTIGDPVETDCCEDDQRLECPNGIINLVNSDEDPIETLHVRSGQTRQETIANVEWTDSTLVVNHTPYGNAIVCTPQIKTQIVIFVPGVGLDTSALATNDSGTNWTFTSIADDGASGTITVSVNGGAYAAFANPTTINNGQTIQVKRTITTGAGKITLTGTHS